MNEYRVDSTRTCWFVGSQLVTDERLQLLTSRGEVVAEIRRPIAERLRALAERRALRTHHRHQRTCLRLQLRADVIDARLVPGAHLLDT